MARRRRCSSFQRLPPHAASSLGDAGSRKPIAPWRYSTRLRIVALFDACALNNCNSEASPCPAPHAVWVIDRQLGAVLNGSFAGCVSSDAARPQGSFEPIAVVRPEHGALVHCASATAHPAHSGPSAKMELRGLPRWPDQMLSRLGSLGAPRHAFTNPASLSFLATESRPIWSPVTPASWQGVRPKSFG